MSWDSLKSGDVFTIHSSITEKTNGLFRHTSMLPFYGVKDLSLIEPPYICAKDKYMTAATIEEQRLLHSLTIGNIFSVTNEEWPHGTTNVKTTNFSCGPFIAIGRHKNLVTGNIICMSKTSRLYVVHRDAGCVAWYKDVSVNVRIEVMT